MVRSIKNLIASFLIAVSSFLFWTQVLPVYTFTADLKTVIQEKSDLLSSRAEIIKRIEELTKERDDKYSSLQRLALVLPDKKSIPEIISASDKMFANSGNLLNGMTIGSADVLGDKLLNKISLEFNAQGSYLSLISLMNYLERNIRLTDVISFSAQTQSDLADEDQSLLSFQITADVYWIKPSAKEVKEGTVSGGGNEEE